MSETERWKPVEGEMIENTFLKSTSNLALRGQITEDASLLVIGYYQARPSRFFKPRATLESQLRVRLGRFTSLGVSFSMTHDATLCRTEHGSSTSHIRTEQSTYLYNQILWN